MPPTSQPAAPNPRPQLNQNKFHRGFATPQKWSRWKFCPNNREHSLVKIFLIIAKKILSQLPKRNILEQDPIRQTMLIPANGGEGSNKFHQRSELSCFLFNILDNDSPSCIFMSFMQYQNIYITNSFHNTLNGIIMNLFNYKFALSLLSVTDWCDPVSWR